MEAIEGLLLDLDGTVYEADRLLSGSAEAIAAFRAAGQPFLFTTNTSRKSRRDVAVSLVGMGLGMRMWSGFTSWCPSPPTKTSRVSRSRRRTQTPCL